MDLENIGKLLKSGITRQKQTSWDSKIVLALLLIGPVIFTFCLCVYLVKRYNKIRSNNYAYTYLDLEDQKSIASDYSDSMFERNENYVRSPRFPVPEYKSDLKKSVLERVRDKRDTEDMEEGSANEDKQKAKFYKREFKKWKTRYNRLKKRVDPEQAGPSFKKVDVKEDKRKDEPEYEQVESDIYESKVDSSAKSKPSLEKQAASSESGTFSEVSEESRSDQKDSKNSLIFN